LAQEVIVLILAAIPVFEVRASVPLGIAVYKLAPLTVIFLSVIGSILPVLPLLWFLNSATERLRKFARFDKFFEWLFTRTRARSKLIADFELIGLTLFIAIPFPGTGVWTGTIAAYLLGLPLIPTFLCAIIGTTIASGIMAAASLGIINFFH